MWHRSEVITEDLRLLWRRPIQPYTLIDGWLVSIFLFSFKLCPPITNWFDVHQYNSTLIDERPSRWRDGEICRNFFDSYAKDAGFDPLQVDSWYAVKLDALVSRQVCYPDLTQPLLLPKSLIVCIFEYRVGYIFGNAMEGCEKHYSLPTQSSNSSTGQEEGKEQQQACHFELSALFSTSEKELKHFLPSLVGSKKSLFARRNTVCRWEGKWNSLVITKGLSCIMVAQFKYHWTSYTTGGSPTHPFLLPDKQWRNVMKKILLGVKWKVNEGFFPSLPMTWPSMMYVLFPFPIFSLN